MKEHTEEVDAIALVAKNHLSVGTDVMKSNVIWLAQTHHSLKLHPMKWQSKNQQKYQNVYVLWLLDDKFEAHLQSVGLALRSAHYKPSVILTLLSPSNLFLTLIPRCNIKHILVW